MDGHASVRAAGAQELIAPGRAISTDHVDLAAGVVQVNGEIGEQIEETRIEVMDVSGAVVAEKVIELVQGFREVGVAALVDDVEMLTGVSVIEAEPLLGQRRLGNVRSVSERREKRQNDEPTTGPKEHRLDPRRSRCV